MAKIRARARAVDMLGRQQIAGIQNALSELFKNAHDAYANVVAVDYFDALSVKTHGFLVVRDDGVGMTRSDFENKWLVLGTESKAGVGRAQQYRPPGIAVRPITGEKGIGRLAIALLGKQVLVVTRAIRSDGTHALVVALIHWGLFEIPGVNLDDIDVPIKEFDISGLPSAEDLSSLREDLIACASQIGAVAGVSRVEGIIEEIGNFAPDPQAINAFLSSKDGNGVELTDGASGTQFFIGPSNPIIKIELDHEDKNQDYSFRKQLIGFYEKIFDEVPDDLIKTIFRRWLPGDIVSENLLKGDEFFTPSELAKADHELSGEIDEYGQFSGILRVYDKLYEDVIIPWPNSSGVPTECGKFRIVFGYLMGRASESRLSPDEYASLNQKLDNLGGMYVYRDRIRILPYGDHSNDWLEVEKRRNKGAGYYFFSFRRMFGAVLLTGESNFSLVEKAGREGFQQNAAYRQLRVILVNLLIQLAAEFFRRGGPNSDQFETAQLEVRKRSEALERQQKRSASKRKNLAASLSAFVLDTTSGLPESEIASLLKVTESRMQAAATAVDQDKAAANLIRAEQEAIDGLSKLREKYTRKRPAGIALTKDLSREWDLYSLERNRLESEVFQPFEKKIGDSLGQIAIQARVYIDQRKRLEERLKIIADERKRQLADASKQVNESASETRRTVLQITERARLALDTTIKNIQSDLNRTDLSAMDPEQVDQMRRKWEESLNDLEGRHRDALMAARDMLASLAENLRASDGEEPSQIIEALEEKMLGLEDQADEDFEMVQLGLAVAIINHEFAASIKRVRKSVQELGHISRTSGSLRPLYESIRSNFEHLDGHLNLFTPLQRRLYRSAQKISGKSLRTYILELFSQRLERHSIEMICTENFLRSSITCFPSTIYPAMINIVDNAIYWSSSLRGKRLIELDCQPGLISISNTGPPIEHRDIGRIFERGYSRKSGGRGLGLFISSRALSGEKITLSVGDAAIPFGVAFNMLAPTLEVGI